MGWNIYNFILHFAGVALIVYSYTSILRNDKCDLKEYEICKSAIIDQDFCLNEKESCIQTNKDNISPCFDMYENCTILGTEYCAGRNGLQCKRPEYAPSNWAWFFMTLMMGVDSSVAQLWTMPHAAFVEHIMKVYWFCRDLLRLCFLHCAQYQVIDDQYGHAEFVSFGVICLLHITLSFIEWKSHIIYEDYSTRPPATKVTLLLPLMGMYAILIVYVLIISRVSVLSVIMYLELMGNHLRPSVEGMHERKIFSFTTDLDGDTTKWYVRCAINMISGWIWPLFFPFILRDEFKYTRMGNEHRTLVKNNVGES